MNNKITTNNSWKYTLKNINNIENIKNSKSLFRNKTKQKFSHKLRFGLFLLLISSFSSTLAAETYTAPEYVNPSSYLSPSYLLRAPIGGSNAGSGAYLSRTNDLSTVVINPASLGFIRHWQFQLGHRDELAKVDFNSFVTNIPFTRSSLSVFGVYGHVYDYENTYYNVPDNPFKKFRAGYAGLGYGHSILGDTISIGGNVKWLSGHADTQYNGLLIDLAVQSKYDLSKLRNIWNVFYYLPEMTVSFVAANIHPQFASSDSDQDADASPSKEFKDKTDSYDFGISLTYPHHFALHLDFINPRDIGDSSVRFGVEVWPAYFLALRTGISTPYYKDKMYSFHAGIGIGHLFSQSNRISVELGFQADMHHKTQIERRHQFSVVSSLGGWNYTARHADDSPVKMTRLINDANGLQIADTKSKTDSKPATADSGWGIVETDKKPGVTIQRPARKWDIGIFQYRGYSGQGKGGEFLAERITKSIIQATLSTQLVKLIPAWKQKKIAPQLKREWGESNEKYFHRLGTTLGADYLLVGVVDMRGSSGFIIQSQLFEVQRKKFVLSYRSQGDQNAIEDSMRTHLNEFKEKFVKVVQKKKTAIPTGM